MTLLLFTEGAAVWAGSAASVDAVLHQAVGPDPAQGDVSVGSQVENHAQDWAARQGLHGEEQIATMIIFVAYYF